VVEIVKNRIEERAKLTREGEREECMVSLIIDATIELKQDSLRLVLCDLIPYIESGSLLVLISKSHQKYATFGMAKVMSGCNLWLYNRNANYNSSNTNNDTVSRFESVMSRLETALKWDQLEESQLMAHLLRFAGDQELAFVSRAAENAHFVSSFCFGDTASATTTAATNHIFESGLPFITLSKGARWAFQGDSSPTKSARSLPDLLHRSLPFEDRDSFSSLSTSFLAMVSVVRFNVGQESKSQLIEKFFAMARLLFPSSSSSSLIAQEITFSKIIQSMLSSLQSACSLDIPSIDSDVCSTIEKLLDCISQTNAIRSNRIVSIIASFLDFTCRLLTLQGDESLTLRKLLEALLSKDSVRLLLSTSSRIDLSVFWLRSFLSSGLNNEERYSNKVDLFNLCKREIPAHIRFKEFVDLPNDEVFARLNTVIQNQIFDAMIGDLFDLQPSSLSFDPHELIYRYLKKLLRNNQLDKTRKALTHWRRQVANDEELQSRHPREDKMQDIESEYHKLLEIAKQKREDQERRQMGLLRSIDRFIDTFEAICSERRRREETSDGNNAFVSDIAQAIQSAVAEAFSSDDQSSTTQLLPLMKQRLESMAVNNSIQSGLSADFELLRVLIGVVGLWRPHRPLAYVKDLVSQTIRKLQKERGSK